MQIHQVAVGAHARTVEMQCVEARWCRDKPLPPSLEDGGRRGASKAAGRVERVHAEELV